MDNMVKGAGILGVGILIGVTTKAIYDGTKDFVSEKIEEIKANKAKEQEQGQEQEKEKEQ